MLKKITDDITPLPELAARAKDLRLRLGETAEEEPYKEWRGKKVREMSAL